MLKQIQNAREEGYSDEEILNYLHGSYEGLQKPIQDAIQEGHEANDILDYIGQVYPAETISKKQLQNLAVEQQPGIEEAQQSEAENRGFISSVRRGFGKGVTGVLNIGGIGGSLIGKGKQITPQDETWLEHFGSLLGETVSDIPGFIAGGLVGAEGGAAVGSIIP